MSRDELIRMESRLTERKRWNAAITKILARFEGSDDFTPQTIAGIKIFINTLKSEIKT